MCTVLPMLTMLGFFCFSGQRCERGDFIQDHRSHDRYKAHLKKLFGLCKNINCSYGLIMIVFFSLDLCSDETDNSPPLQLHTLKEFEQVRDFILNYQQAWCECHFLILQHNTVVSSDIPIDNMICGDILWLHFFLQEVMSCGAVNSRWVHSLFRKSMLISKLSGIYDLTTVQKRRTSAADDIRWKIPWTLLVVKVCLRLQDGPL